MRLKGVSEVEQYLSGLPTVHTAIQSTPRLVGMKKTNVTSG
jgi:hypothetical protein